MSASRDTTAKPFRRKRIQSLRYLNKREAQTPQARQPKRRVSGEYTSTI